MSRFTVALVAVAAFALATSSTAHATWSIVGIDADTGEVGVAVASCVGFEVSVVPVIVPGFGAAASQADISSASGDRFVEALEAASDAEATIDAVVAADEAADSRQFGAVVLDGGAAGWSGADTSDVSLDRQTDSVSVQGNILTSEDVVADAIAAWEATEGALADRLLAALTAGADAGGDSRCGSQTATAAALIVGRPGDAGYAFTDRGVTGVDPESDDVPSIFLSVLVEQGDERAVDRLADVWAAADQTASSVVIRQIDDGADTAFQRSQTIVLVALGAIGVLLVGVVVIIVRSRRQRADRSSSPPPTTA